jgi:hypothetical protein
MIKRYCDKCGCELQKDKGYGFGMTKSYTVSFIHRDIITREKEIYDDKEYCQDCFFSFVKLYNEFKKDKVKKDSWSKEK